MHYYVVLAFSCSIFIAAVAGAIRLPRMDREYHPFVFATCLAAANEIISFYTAKQFHSNAINNNVYLLLETLLIAWQFYRWTLFGTRRTLYAILQGITLTVWLLENIYAERLNDVGLYFRLYAAFIIVFMSVCLNSRVITDYRKSLLRYPAFIICSAYILYYTVGILFEALWVYGISLYPEFQTQVFYVLVFLNLIVNFIFAFAVLCIPVKPRYILLH